MRTEEEIDLMIDAVFGCVNAIQKETTPIPEHTDIGAITDCFNEIYEMLGIIREAYHAQFEQQPSIKAKALRKKETDVWYYYDLDDKTFDTDVYPDFYAHLYKNRPLDSEVIDIEIRLQQGGGTE